MDKLKHYALEEHLEHLQNTRLGKAPKLEQAAEDRVKAGEALSLAGPARYSNLFLRSYPYYNIFPSARQTIRWLQRKDDERNRLLWNHPPMRKYMAAPRGSIEGVARQARLDLEADEKPLDEQWRQDWAKRGTAETIGPAVYEAMSAASQKNAVKKHLRDIPGSARPAAKGVTPQIRRERRKVQRALAVAKPPVVDLAHQPTQPPQVSV